VGGGRPRAIMIDLEVFLEEVDIGDTVE